MGHKKTKFKEKQIQVEFVVGEDEVKEVITSRIELPEVKPDMDKVLDMEAIPSVTEASIVEDGVEIRGEIKSEVVYVCDQIDPYEPQQWVHLLEGEQEFSLFLDITGARPGMNLIAEVDVLHTSFSIIDARTMEVSVTVREFVKVTEYRQLTVITDIKGISYEQIEEESLRIEDVIGEKSHRQLVEAQIKISQDNPPAERIIRALSRVMDVNIDLAEDQLTVSGTVEASAVYISDGSSVGVPLHFASGKINFEKAMNIPGVKPGMSAMPSVRVVNVSSHLVDLRTIEFNIVLDVFVKVAEPKEIMVLVDVKSDEVDIKKDLLQVEEIIGQKTVKEVLAQSVEIPQEKPPVDRVLEARASVIEITPTVEENGVFMVGQLEVRVLYIAAVPSEELDQPVQFVARTVQFENFIPVSGAEPNFISHTSVVVQSLDTRVINDRTVEVNVNLEEYARVTNLRQLEIIVDMVVIAPVIREPCPPAYIIYVVQPGDTLFRIARRFQTTVEALLQVNEMEDPDRIDVGQKLCVPKKIIKPKG